MLVAPKSEPEKRPGQALKKLHEYEAHAAECRAMARTAPASHRIQLEQMAQTWDQLAEARRNQLEKQGKTSEDEIMP
jgi:hypothetical protein